MIFYKLFQNIATCYRRTNLFWQGIMIAITFVCVATGFDWFYFEATRSATIHSLFFPAVIVGFLLPVFLPVVMLLYGAFVRNKRIQNAAYAAQQAVESGEAVVVGVNRFEEADGHPTATFRIDPEMDKQVVLKQLVEVATRLALDVVSNYAATQGPGKDAT